MNARILLGLATLMLTAPAQAKEGTNIDPRGGKAAVRDYLNVVAKLNQMRSYKPGVVDNMRIRLVGKPDRTGNQAFLAVHGRALAHGYPVAAVGVVNLRRDGDARSWMRVRDFRELMVTNAEWRKAR